MTYPPQQPQDGWANQQPGQQQPPADQQPADPNNQQPVSPFGDQVPQNPFQQQGYPPQGGYPPPGQQPPGQAPVSGAPVSGTPVSGYPVSGTPVSGQPISGGAYSGSATPPGVPESPFAPAPSQAMTPRPPVQPPTAWGARPPTRKRRGVPPWIYAVGAVIVVAAMGVGAYLILQSSSDDDTTQPPPGGPSADQTQQPAVVLSDSTSGLGYAQLGEPWTDQVEEVAGFTSLAGQSYTDDSGATGGFTVGEIDASAVDTSDGLRSVLDSLIGIIETDQYVDGEGEPYADLTSGGADAEREFIRIDSRQAILRTFNVSWTDEDGTARSETVIVGVVELGDERIGAVYAHVPDADEAQVQSVRDTVYTIRFD